MEKGRGRQKSRVSEGGEREIKGGESSLTLDDIGACEIVDSSGVPTIRIAVRTSRQTW